MITEMKAGHLKDIDKPSEPFEVIGKIIPRYENENWTFTELLYEAPYLKSYQDEEDEEDEEADCLEYIDNSFQLVHCALLISHEFLLFFLISPTGEKGSEADSLRLSASSNTQY